MDPGGDKQERPAAPDASQIADAMATAIKACAVWPRRNRADSPTPIFVEMRRSLAGSVIPGVKFRIFLCSGA